MVTDRDGLEKYVGVTAPVTDDRPSIEYATRARRGEFARVLPEVLDLYLIANTEPMYRFDKDDIDPARVQFGLGWVMNARIRPELLYYANWGRVGPDDTLAFNTNIIRLNIKVGLNHALLGNIWNPGHER